MQTDWLQRLPKAELHVHLEGFVDAPFWRDLLIKHSLDPVPPLAELEARYHYPDFAGFIRCFSGVVKSFYTADDFYQLTRYALAKQAAQGIVYTETYLTPLFYANKNLDFKDVLWAIDQAAREAEGETGIVMRLLLDGARNFGPESVQLVFERATQDPTGRVIGVGLGGDEARFPARLFQANFAWAAAQGLHCVCHAGETAGEASMLEAVELLQAKRLGHALAVQPQTRLEALILQGQIALELCPTSNRRTGQIATLEQHPFARYFQAGYPVVLGSDDPGFFGSDLLGELRLMAQLHSLSQADLAQLARNSFCLSFLRKPEQATYLTQIERHLQAP